MKFPTTAEGRSAELHPVRERDELVTRNRHGPNPLEGDWLVYCWEQYSRLHTFLTQPGGRPHFCLFPKSGNIPKGGRLRAARVMINRDKHFSTTPARTPTPSHNPTQPLPP